MVAILIEDRASDELLTIGSSLEDLLRGSLLVGRAAQIVVDEIKAEVRQSFRDQSGRLEDSWKVQVQEVGGDRVTAAAVTDAPYALIQNTGGTILPRGNRLAIPLPGADVPRGKWPRDFPRGALFKITSKRGNELLMSTTTKRPMFVLKNRVTLRGTGYLDRAIDAAEPRITELVETEVQFVIDREEG